MFYICKATCISPQQTFPAVDLDAVRTSADNKLFALEPKYEGIPANVLRRMSKTVKLAIASAMPLISAEHPPAGIIIGTANGGMEESGRFLNQIVEYDEDMLTPGNFVQSTPNTATSQLCLLLNNKNYNITHVQRGLAFENAMIDAAMLLNEHPEHTYLLGGVDEIASYNYEIDRLQGWFRQQVVSNKDLYQAADTGSIAGEGAAMFLIGKNANGALAELKAIQTLHTSDLTTVKLQLQAFILKHLPNGKQPDLLLSGENGDSRLLPSYQMVEEVLSANTAIVRYKHMSGEYPTASAFALWLSCLLLSRQITLPEHMLKNAGEAREVKNIFIYNNHKGAQHSFMLVSQPLV